MSRRTCYTLLTVLVLFAGCSPTARVVVRTTGMKKLPPNCDIAFQGAVTYIDPALYQNVGTIKIEYSDLEWTDRMKSAVRPKACELGGDIAAMMGIFEGPINIASVMVLKLVSTRKESPPPPPPGPSI